MILSFLPKKHRFNLFYPGPGSPPGPFLLQGGAVIVTSDKSLEALLKFIEENEVLAYDTETTGLNPRKDSIIGFGISTKSRGFYIPISSYDAQSRSLRDVPNGKRYAEAALAAIKSKKVIMFNASFDIRFTKNFLGVDLTDALYCDVMLLKHTCDENFPLDLKGIATKLWGHDVKEEKEAMLRSIKEAGCKPTQYYTASLPTVSKYCVQDCILTFRIFEVYSADAKRQGLENFYYNTEVLPLYKEVTIPMEERGVRLDMPKLYQAKAEIKEDLKSLEDAIQAAIVPHLALFESWFLTKEYPRLTTTGKPSAWTKKHTSAAEAFKHDNPNCYMFNLLSKHHLKKLFFDTLGEKSIAKTPTGQNKVDEDFLDLMAAKYEWCKQLIEFNKLTKLCGTYIERLIEESENGRFYPAFQQHRTVSGRLAGDFQQLPRPLEPGQSSPVTAKHTNRIREFIIADEGSYLVSADYEQLEPSIFAHVSGDAALQAIFHRGVDFYSEIAIRTERIPGVSSDKSSPSYLGKTNKAARQKAKAYSLGIAYGMTGYKLKFEIGCDDETADTLVKNYLTAFPDLAIWIENSKRTAKNQGMVKTQAGRIRHIPEAKNIFTKWGNIIEDDLELWKALHERPHLYIQAKEDRKTFKNCMNNACNFQIQSLAASIINRASIKLARIFKESNMKSIIVAQIHDELVLSVPDFEKEQVHKLVKHTMETIVKLGVPLRTEPKAALNFKDCK